MSASSDFKKLFTKKNLTELYTSNIRYKPSIGLDKVNKKIFDRDLIDNIDVIYRKVINGSYTFTTYREKLILRSAHKTPRIVSIPTIRDKLTLRVLFDILQNTFFGYVPFLHNIINDISNALNSNIYDGVLRLDVKNFYPSIDHDILFKRLKNYIKKSDVLDLILKAIKNPTATQYKAATENNKIGVPQGLSISNILANIYFLHIDELFSARSDLIYFRYVDDILILTKCNKLDEIKNNIITECSSINLELHNDDPEKANSCEISQGFEYLGYSFNGTKISVRKKSINHLRDSLIKLFTNFKYSENNNLKYFKWAVDLRVTGCILNKTKYGWLFFFSQINDVQLLKSLDVFIVKLMDRFDIDQSKIQFKKFTRSYHEIVKNLSNSKYIPNFDEYSISKKRVILSDIFDYKTSLMIDYEIVYQFNKKIYRTVQDLEKDLARAS